MMKPRSQPQRPSPKPSLPTQGGPGSLGQRNRVVLTVGTHAPLVGTNWQPRTEGRLSQSPMSTWDPAVPLLEMDLRETPVNTHTEQVPGWGQRSSNRDQAHVNREVTVSVFYSDQRQRVTIQAAFGNQCRRVSKIRGQVKSHKVA